MAWSPTLIALRDLMVYLYPTAKDAAIVLAEAGIPSGNIDFAGGANQFWHSIIAETERRRQLDDLVAAAQRRFPSQDWQPYAQLQQATDERAKGPDTKTEPDGHELREVEKLRQETAQLEYQPHETPASLEDQVAHAGRLLATARRNLAYLEEQIQQQGAEASLHQLNQRDGAQADVEKHAGTLGQLQQLLDVALQAGVPHQMTFGDFLQARLSGTVLHQFMKDLQGDFDDLAVVRAMRQQAPAYLRRVAQRLLRDPDAADEQLAQALHSHILEFVDRPGNGFIRAPGGKYRQIRF